jgi:FKBP-type peptidyl-prolyl cis-trans isomerase FkpA
MRRLVNLLFNSSFVYLALLLLISCHQSGWRETESGMKYKILRNSNGEKPANGNYLYLNMDYYDENDSLLFTYRDKGIPVTIQYIDSVWDHNGQIYEGLKKLNVGDSAIFKVNCENLYLVSFRGSIPYGLDPKSEITFYIGVENKSTAEEFRLWYANLILKKEEETRNKKEQQLFEDIAIIDEFMEMHGLIPLEHELGLRYIILEEGDGQKPSKGDHVTIHFRGELLDGSIIDSSYDHKAPIDFILGSGAVIEGWEIGIPLMSKGARYTFYIPSTLAYGEAGYGNLIKPNSILVYEIELLDIE